MGRRYQNQSDRESEVSFRVVEIYVAGKSPDGKREQRLSFLLVDNRRETLETVQMNMHDFVRNAILANKIDNQDNKHRIENVSQGFPGIVPAVANKGCATI